MELLIWALVERVLWKKVIPKNKLWFGLPTLLTKPLFIMNTQNLEKQQNLIRVLLTYPTQASKVLNNNQQLIDHNFVELIEQKSIRFMSYGNHQAANFLKDLASQIKIHFLSEVVQVSEATMTANESSANWEHDFNASSINWEHELQKFNLRAQEISSQDSGASHNELEREEEYARYKWLPFFILTVSLILASGWLFWYRASGHQFLGNSRGGNYTFSVFQ